ncbi:SDR family oxidoreductase [Noviherbaspirillum aridicola]|uniref:Short-chain dehydrogenase/reductase n=1 Tax=Noviherbaspirillum aridicola TaxID=2849687 RepID=A0ABQ4Q3N7_9BURK|nr:SDR family oxidoreductase [Noviherbaspirillum aridicola]GIZ51798.1 short-chain dehydrogenase/reductase [Noviherbaspirillum aridicola]
MPTALIIGASRGIGHEFVRQLREGGWKVFATARDDAGLQALRDLGAEALKLDVTKPESLAGLGWQLDGEQLDLAVYVAGVYGPQHQERNAPTLQDFDNVMHTNVFGAMQAIPLLAPMVEAARGKFAFISSGMGSIGEAESSYGWLYRASKAALNMAVKTAAFDHPDAVFVALCPGWVRTDMGGPNASISVEESVSGLLDVIGQLGPQDTGSYRNYAGRNLAW